LILIGMPFPQQPSDHSLLFHDSLKHLFMIGFCQTPTKSSHYRELALFPPNHNQKNLTLKAVRW
jgi:hypothetical protein